MKDDATDIAIQLAYALGAWERGEAGAKERHQALYERLLRMAKGGTQPRRTCLRVVHSDDSYPTCRATGGDGIDRETQDRMRWYGKHISEFRDSVIGFAKNRPTLTLVDTTSTESKGVPK